MPQFPPLIGQQLDIQQPKLLGPMDAVAQALGIRAQQQGVQMNALKLKEAQQEMADEQDIRAAAQQFGGDLDKMQQFLNTKNPQAAAKFASAVASRRKTEAETVKSDLENSSRKLELTAQALQGVKDESSFQRGRTVLASILGPQAAQALGDTYDPAKVQQFVDGSLKHKEWIDAQQKATDQAQKAQEIAINQGKESREARTAWEKSIAEAMSATDSQADMDNVRMAQIHLGAPADLFAVYGNEWSPAVKEKAKTALGRTPQTIPHNTVTTEQGVFQYNPATQKYDIRIGDRPKPAGAVVVGQQAYADLDEKTKAAVDSVARKVATGQFTVTQGQSALGGVRGGLGGALTEALGESTVLPAAVRTQYTDIQRAKNLMTPVKQLVEEINNTPSLTDKIKKSSQLENYVQSIGTQFARAKGERGVVTDRDVNRVLGLIPGWKSANFAPGFAQENLKLIEDTFERDQNALLKNYFTPVDKEGNVTAPAAGGNGKADTFRTKYNY